MAFEFTPERRERFEKLLTRYPHKMPALLPTLHLVQEQLGYVSPEAIEYVAGLLDVSAAHVDSVVSFYTMYNRAPRGKYFLQVCTNISCSLCGSRDLVEHIKSTLHLDIGETSADGRFSLIGVECLAACELAPAVQINDDYHGPMTKPDFDRWLAGVGGAGGDGAAASKA
ncbi:MAG: NAD(P)H-dependent oxidoreductase subunit E [Myxococcales bacterium]|nr:NAD(P)H-dependent oxidoreductase subunit E [Myxococcales bacterium]